MRKTLLLDFVLDVFDVLAGFAHVLVLLALPDREAAELWARKLALACRCSQELREFLYDPES